jgi:hypothetical protein
MDLELDTNFKAFLSLLERQDAQYLLIGGYAVNYHNHHRSTNDMDIYISAAPNDATKVARALHDFGFAEVDQEGVPEA